MRVKTWLKEFVRGAADAAAHTRRNVRGLLASDGAIIRSCQTLWRMVGPNGLIISESAKRRWESLSLTLKHGSSPTVAQTGNGKRTMSNKLTIPEKILRAIQKHGPMNTDRLAKLTGAKSSSVSAACSRLKARGMLVRVDGATGSGSEAVWGFAGQAKRGCK